MNPILRSLYTSLRLLHHSYIYVGAVVGFGDNFLVSLNCAVFSDGSGICVPKFLHCFTTIITYFRILNLFTDQFERTLIITDGVTQLFYSEKWITTLDLAKKIHVVVVELISL